MSRIGIVTFFKSNNYGVWLQAYATQRALEELGHEAEMINYTNKEEENLVHYSYKEGDRLSGYATSFLKSLIFGKVRYYKKSFGNHVDEYFHVSAGRYQKASEMKDLTYDVLVAGSDQIWSPDTTFGNLDEVFLLQFGNAGKRISIASSIGSKPVSEADKPLFRRALETFYAISVREDFAKEQLQVLTTKPIKVVSDPTFLLSRKAWISLIREKAAFPCKKGTYILAYFVSTDKRSERYVKLLEGYRRRLNLPIWLVQFSTYKKNQYDRTIVGATMADFLKLILRAGLVITDSFHGTALSANLNTNFVSIENRKNPERVRNLLRRLDLLERIDLAPEDYAEIDYEKVNPKIKAMRMESLQWVKHALEEEI